MIDLEKLAQEFAFLREKIKEVAKHLKNSEHSEATFVLGCLHSICHNHAVSIGALVPPKFEQVPPVAPESPKYEQPAV